MMRKIGLAAFALPCFLASAARAEMLIDPGELEAWADAYYDRAVAEKRAAGITVSVVQDGEIIFAKGYGYADYGERRPVDPETSGFFVGSITKTFIATAIGQLIDSGVIASFDDPANKYLKRVQLPGDRGSKVTIRHLLNHRAGFADTNFGSLDGAGLSPDVPLSAREILRFMPEIVMEPGGSANYSNWSFSVLGFLIEDATGERLDHYLEKNIWEPLGMSHTSLAYPEYPDNLSLNYEFEKDGTPVGDPVMQPHPWISPAGTIVSTAVDMARYMNAHVLEGEEGGYPLVSKEMFRDLHEERYRNAPISNGFSHTFWTMRLNGEQTIEHGGGAPGFQSMMVMIPEKDMGFFASSMQGGLVDWAGYSEEEVAAGKAVVHDPLGGFELRQSFVDRFLTEARPAEGEPIADLSRLTGVYWTQKRAFTTAESLGGAFDPAAVLTIETTADGKGLLINGYGPYRPLGGGVFESPSGQVEWRDPYNADRARPAHIAFSFDGDGDVDGLYAGLADQRWAPASPVFNPHAMLKGFALFSAAGLSGAFLFLWPRARRFSNATNYLGLAIALLVLVFPYMVMGGFAKGDSLDDQIMHGDRTRLVIMAVAANAMVIAAAAFWISFFREGRKDPFGGAGRLHAGRSIHAALVGVGAVGLPVVFGFFNLLGFHLPG